MSDIYPAPCVHGSGETLCPECLTAWEYDPASYDEYGDHPEGLRRWHALQAEMTAWAAEPRGEPDPDLPF